MKSIISLLLIIMVLSACNGRPQEGRETIKWDIAAKLPDRSDGRPHPGLAGAITGIHHGLLLIAGGANFPEAMPWQGGLKAYHDTGYIFIKNKDGQFALQPERMVLNHPVAYAAVASTDYGVVVAGGENAEGITRECFLLSVDSATHRVWINSLPALPTPLTNACMATMANVVYLAGGESPEGISDKVYRLDLGKPDLAWQVLAPLPHKVTHAVLTALGTPAHPILLLAGGRCKMPDGVSRQYADVFSLDVWQGKWKRRRKLPHTLSAACGIAISPEQMLVFGGDKGTVFTQVEKLIAAISSETDSVRKQALIVEKNSLQASHPGFSHHVLMYHATNDAWRFLDSIPFEAPVTTNAVKWDNEVIIGSGEIRAGVRTPSIIRGVLNLQ